MDFYITLLRLETDKPTHQTSYTYAAADNDYVFAFVMVSAANYENGSGNNK